MSGEYEPNDSRNVTGANQGQTPNANGEMPGQPQQQSQGGTQQGGSGSTGMGQSTGQAGSGLEPSGQQRQFEQSSGQMGSAGGVDSDSQGRFADRIREHMQVIDSEGEEIGTVDSIDGDRIKLTRQDSSDGEHHYLSLDQVAGIEGDTVRLAERGDTTFGMSGE